ncbi:nitrate- and nitrite sensing domain-containing protein [Actinoplanes sp. N902-109]|uniref:nitrate- and nitrite sensing domain-containing protein n=1 Tax=Actinoplanes sp. (strain N902-109) TaxID=649831 RepID=UPI00032942A9|nr:nitrate- and nitrite sensing domain-containing protein [Actinoplanes sp. N902-109]AGL14876.1 ATP-binding protein [Actinoplanes sp. N902-109]
MRSRSWSIRSKIIALVAVPLTALLALWAFATAITAGPAVKLLSARTLLDSVGDPGEALVSELQHERRLSVAYLSDAKADPAPLVAQRAATDRATARFRSTAVAAVSGEARRAGSSTLATRIQQIVTDLESLGQARRYIDARDIDVVGAQNLYNGIVDTSFQMFAATATFGDDKVDREIRALTTVGRGQEFLSRVDALLAGAYAGGKLSAAGRTELIQAIGTARFLFSQGVADLPQRDRSAYQKLTAGAAFNRLDDLQDQLLAASRPGVAAPVPAQAWQPAYDATTQQLRTFELNASDSLASDARPVAVDILVRLGLAGLLGLAALIVSIVVSVRVGRSIVGRLVRLRGEALEMADQRLPSVIRRLQRGDTVDVRVETPPLEYGRDEIGQLGHAFTEVQHTAMQSAVEEANVRRGINEVFLNIARRSQTLLHRQLALLDKMERRETEPAELEDLYRVDHLATRMRRHAEDLVILAGAAPGRGWRNPVPLIDVVRGAISEVEDYKRVDIMAIQPSAVLGRAVGDVIHLIAELLENAASFSPPTTRVQVVGQVLPNGYAVEIEDRGLGMSTDAIAEANRKLLEPPEFDPADSARLGLFVVAQLAARHGIRVSLRPSAYGGITAVVMLPGDLITAAPPGPGALQVGTPPATKPLDQPVLGTGTDTGPSLAALQWQGTEKLRSIPMRSAGAPTDAAPATSAPAGASAPPDAAAAVPATAVSPADAPAPVGAVFPVDAPAPAGAVYPADAPAPVGAVFPVDAPAAAGAVYPADAPAPVDASAPGAKPVTGPTPSAIADGLTADGLVQRRRTAPRRTRSGRIQPPAQLPPNLNSPVGLAAAPASPAGAAPAATTPTAAAPAPAPAPPAVSTPDTAAPAIAAPAVSTPAAPVTAAPAASTPAAPVTAAPAVSTPAAPVTAAPAASIPAAPVTAAPAASTPAVPVTAAPAASIPAAPATPDANGHRPDDAGAVAPGSVRDAGAGGVTALVPNGDQPMAPTIPNATPATPAAWPPADAIPAAWAPAGPPSPTGLPAAGAGIPIAPAPVTPALPPRVPAASEPVLPRVPTASEPVLPRVPTASEPVLPRVAAASEPVLPVAGDADERLLPRRVRQASLVPQLRGPVVERAEATTVRSPEKVRSLMSALQRGTTQGRRDAAALLGSPLPTAPGDQPAPAGEQVTRAGDTQPRVTDKQQTTGQPTWSEAATVTFPAVGTPPVGEDGGTDATPDDNDQNHRPEKDA